MDFCMDVIASIVAWVLCLGIGVPLAFLGVCHFAFPKAAWSVYRAWGRLWKADPQVIAPNYNSGAAMRVVGITCGLAGLAICLVPKLLGF